MESLGRAYLTMEKDQQKLNEPNENKMAVEKIESAMILLRKGFNELRSSDIDQMDALDAMNTALYKLDQRVSDVRKAFYKE